MSEHPSRAALTAVAAAPRRWRLTADQYQRMGETGIFHADDRVELLDGELYEMSPIGSWHNACVNRLNRRLSAGLGARAILQVQGSFRLSPNSEPEPDILVLRFRPDFYQDALPGPEDVLLLIEVADATLAYDRGVKLPLYARAGISEVWIVSRDLEQIEVYREPRGGAYHSVGMVERDAMLRPLAFPDLAIPVQEILG